jgi:transposase, IS30 family
MLMTREGKGVGEVGRFLKRSPSTISREADRDLGFETDYDATLAGEQAIRLRIKPRKESKLVVGA